MKPLTTSSGARRWSGCFVGRSIVASGDWVTDDRQAWYDDWVGAFNHLRRRELLSDLAGLAWTRPDSVQVLILGQDDECWGLWMLRGAHSSNSVCLPRAGCR